MASLTAADSEGKDILSELELLKKEVSTTTKYTFKIKMLCFNFLFRITELLDWATYKSRKFSLSFVVLIAFFMTLTINIESVNAYALSWIMNSNTRYTEIKISQAEIESNTHSEYKQFFIMGSILPKYIPEGFNIVAISFNEIVSTIEYENSLGEFIYFKAETSSSVIRIDTEDAEYETVVLNGNQTFLSYDNYQTTLMWQQGDYFLVISTDISRDELFKIAENISL